MSKRIGLVQTRGIGDIIIALPIADFLIQQGYDVFWPIDEQIVSAFQQVKPEVNFITVIKGAGDLLEKPLTAVKQKAYSMGIKTREWRLWSANEIKLLKKLYPSENTQSIADKLGRSRISINHKACNIGLKKVGTPPVWSRQEDALLKKLYPHKNVRDIANQLGRTVPAVWGRAHNLGISKPQHIWSKKELNLLELS